MDDRDLLDIKQKLLDIEATLNRSHATLFEAVTTVDNQVGKNTEVLVALMKQVSPES